MPGRKRAPGAWIAIRPAAKARMPPTNCSRATAAPGVSSVDVYPAPFSCQPDRRSGPGRARDHGRQAHGGADRGQSGPDRDLPDRRIKPETTLSNAGDGPLVEAHSMGSYALVHWRRTFRTALRLAEQHGRGAWHFS